MDIYPTLLDCCGLPARADLEGISLRPLLSDPQRPWKQAAFSQFPRPWMYQGEPEVMGYTMRTDRYRLVLWQDVRERKAEPIFVELFDHKTDPRETKNIAADFPELVRDLRKQLG